jgi:hypothetical protein
MISNEGSELTDPKATKTTLSPKEEKNIVRTLEAQSRKGVIPRQHLPPRILGEQQQKRAVNRTLTLHKSHTQYPVGTSKKQPPCNSQRPRRRGIAQGTREPHDGPAKVPIRLDAGRHKGVTGVQMACMRPLLAPVAQSGSGTSRRGGSGSVGRAARMSNGNFQQDGTMGRGKRHLNVGPRPLTADCCNANGSVTGLHTPITARVGGDVAESFLPVAMPTRVAPAQTIATHGVVD